jgi:uncharacterized membrane protein
MIPLIGVKLPKGNGILLTATISGATTSLTNPSHTDVYTDGFPNGITIDMPIEEFYDLWLSSLESEIEWMETEDSVD